MSDYLLGRYRPVADALIALHKLSLPEATRDMIAKRIMHSRRLPREKSGRANSPIPALKKAKTHACALLEYAEHPPTRRDSVRKRCSRLRTALCDGMLAMEIGIFSAKKGAGFDYGTLLDSLEAGHAETETLVELMSVLASIEALSGNWRVGRPWGLAKPVVRAGCIAWKRAGRTERYSWREDRGAAGDKEARGTLSGPLPDFLRDLIACCNGTHGLVASLEQVSRSKPPSGYSFERPKVQGTGLTLSDKYLQLAIMDCKNSGLL